MATSGIPARVAEFIRRHIDSVGQLEVLLLLHGNSDRSWTPAQVGKELGLGEDFAAAILDTFAGKGQILSGDEGYRFSPASADAAVVQELDATYKKRRVTVIGAIFSKPEEDVESFADAFRLKKPDKEEG